MVILAAWERLAGVIRCSELPDDRDLDLTRVLKVFLQFAGDPAGEIAGTEVVHLSGVDHDPNLAPGLHGEHLLDTPEIGSQRLEPLKPANVGLESLPPGTRPRRRYRIGSLD